MEHDCAKLEEWGKDRCCKYCHARREFHCIRKIKTDELLHLCCTAVSFIFGNQEYRFDLDKEEVERALTQTSLL